MGERERETETETERVLNHFTLFCKYVQENWFRNDCPFDAKSQKKTWRQELLQSRTVAAERVN